MSLTHSPDGLAPVLGRRSAIAIAAVAICGLALALRTGLLGVTPAFDEYYHLLAARGLLETGRPAILDGEYTRTLMFTRAVAWLFAATGSATLETGRLVALVAGVLIPPVLFLWLRARAGWGAALIAATLAIFWPQGIEEAQLLRFYSWQVLTFLVGAIAVFEAAQPRAGTGGADRAGWAALALASLGAAIYLQIISAIGIVAILAWLGATLVLPPVWQHPARWSLLGGLALLSLATLSALVWSGIFAEAWALSRWSADWNAKLQNQVTYYSLYLGKFYPVFWPLLPVAALLAFRRLPWVSAYCAVIFGVVLVGESFSGMKSVRYLSYGMPFFFALVAIALRDILPAAAKALLRAAEAANPTRLRWVPAAIVLVAAAFFAFVNPFFSVSLRTASGQVFGGAEPDWTRMRGLLDDWAEVPFRMTMRELHTTAALGDYDVLVVPERLSELPDRSEFALDPRTGRPVAGAPRSIAAILRCKPEGLLLADGAWWDEKMAEFLPLFEAAGREVEIRSRDRLFALRWSGGAADPAACAALPL